HPNRGTRTMPRRRSENERDRDLTRTPALFNLKKAVETTDRLRNPNSPSKNLCLSVSICGFRSSLQIKLPYLGLTPHEPPAYRSHKTSLDPQGPAGAFF